MKKLLFVLALCLMARSAHAGVGDVNGISYETSVTATGRSVTFQMGYWKYDSCTWTRHFYSTTGVIDSSGVVHVAGVPPAVYPQYNHAQINVTTGATTLDVYSCYVTNGTGSYALLLASPVHWDTLCFGPPPGPDPNPQPGNGLPPDNPPTDPTTGPGGPA